MVKAQKFWRRLSTSIAPLSTAGWRAIATAVWNGLKAKPLGGRPPKLDGKKMQWVYDTVTRKNPLQIEIRCSRCGRARWWLQLIKDKFGIKLSARVGGPASLAQLGITCQKPLHRA